MSVLKDIEDMRSMALDRDQVRELVGRNATRVLIWSTADGHPVGGCVAYVFDDGVFWTTTRAGRKRVKALSAQAEVIDRGGKGREQRHFQGRAQIAAGVGAEPRRTEAE
jgi:hypothetical protein